jgi:hypothetical protein
VYIFGNCLQFPPVVLSTAERISIASMCMGLQQEFALPATDELITYVKDQVDEAARKISVALNGPIRKFNDGANVGEPSDGNDEGKMRSRYKPLLKMHAPQGVTDAEEIVYQERQLRCFAADWLTLTSAKVEFEKLNQSRRSWSFILQR